MNAVPLLSHPLFMIKEYIFAWLASSYILWTINANMFSSRWLTYELIFNLWMALWIIFLECQRTISWELSPAEWTWVEFYRHIHSGDGPSWCDPRQRDWKDPNAPAPNGTEPDHPEDGCWFHGQEQSSRVLPQKDLFQSRSLLLWSFHGLDWP